MAVLYAVPRLGADACTVAALTPNLAQARLFLKLGRQADAEAAYRGLIAINTENYRYHEGLQAALQLPAAAAVGAPAAAGAAGAAGAAAAEQQMSEEQRQRLAEVYGELQREHPHSVTARRMPLDFLVSPSLSSACLLACWPAVAWAACVRRSLNCAY